MNRKIEYQGFHSYWCALGVDVGHLYDHQYGDECGWPSDEYLLSVWRGDREWYPDDASAREGAKAW